MLKNVALTNSNCGNCGGEQMREKDWQVWVNELGDLVWDGYCESCGGEMTRYLETGENPEIFERAMVLRRQKIEVLKEYQIRPEHLAK